MKYPHLGDSSTAILYLAVKATVRPTGTEEEFGEPVTSTQHVFVPRGASEIEMNVYQVRGGLLAGCQGVHTVSCFPAVSSRRSPAGACGGCGGGKFGGCG